jgi:hypothetical protein
MTRYWQVVLVGHLQTPWGPLLQSSGSSVGSSVMKGLNRGVHAAWAKHPPTCLWWQRSKVDGFIKASSRGWGFWKLLVLPRRLVIPVTRHTS